jgi:hypothetical protein
MRTVVRILGLFLATLLSGSALAQVTILYAADGAGGNPACRLYTLNPATGAVVTNIGPIGMAVTGLAVHPATGVLYGTTGGASPVNPNSLITINRTTGAGTLVGAHGTGPIADIAFRADGTLFGWSEGTDDLVTINLANGVATVVGNSGVNTFGSGLAMSPANVLFFAGEGASSNLRTVNQATGLTTVVAALAGAPQAGGTINAMAFSPTGVLFGSNGNFGGAGGAVNLVTINTATAAVTNVGVSLPGMDAIAFAVLPAVAGQVPPVPTLSEWSLIVLAILIALVGLAQVRRGGFGTRTKV